jgi:ketosteroid isomerase-like protein
MRTKAATIVIAGIVATFVATRPVRAAHSDQAAIAALEDRLVKAIEARDVPGIMTAYVPGASLIVFDAIPPLEYQGAAAYATDWQGALAGFKGPIDLKLTELEITVGGNVAFSSSIQQWITKDANGNPSTLTLRVTDGYVKRDGKWLIAHEHLSVPVDLATGKADLNAKP